MLTRLQAKSRNLVFLFSRSNNEQIYIFKKKNILTINLTAEIRINLDNLFKRILINHLYHNNWYLFHKHLTPSTRLY